MTRAAVLPRRMPSPSLTVETLLVGLGLESRLMRRIAASRDIRWHRIGRRRFISLRRAEDVDHVLQRNRLNYVKSAEYEGLRRAANVNLLVDEGDSWAHHRAALNPMFARRHLNELVDLMVDPVLAMADDMVAAPDRTVIDIHESMVRMTLRVVANSLFSQDFGEIVDRMHDLATKGLRAQEILLRLGLVGALPSPAWTALVAIARLPVPAPPPFHVVQQVMRGFDSAVDRILDERQAHPTDTPDLLNLLLQADDGGWPRQRVRDEALIFMLAGHETTANALAWFWYLMAINPDDRTRMLDEVDQVLGGRRPTADDLSLLPWTTACVMESQRYYSAVPMIVRTAVADDRIAGQPIPAGTSVFIPIHAIHHDPDYWPQPEHFDPTRFLPDAPRPTRSTFLPFGGGRRICIGQSFAMMEMVLIAAALSQRFVFDLQPCHPVTVEQSLTLRPADGIRVVARRRNHVGTTRRLSA